MTINESPASVISRAAVKLHDQGGSQHLVDLLHNAAALLRTTALTAADPAPTWVGDAAFRFAKEILNGQLNLPDQAPATPAITAAYCMVQADEHLKLAVSNVGFPGTHLETAKLYLDLADRAAVHGGQR